MIDEVAQVLQEAPGLTPTQIRDVLRRRGRAALTSADVARTLRSAPARFRSDDEDRWSLGRQQPRLPAAAPALPLYAWQQAALDAWRQQGRRGVVEAVTGAGKTRVGVAALRDELAAGGQAVVLVPTRDLLHQWRAQLAAALSPAVRVGLRGDGESADLDQHDVVVAVVNSARETLRPRRPGGLLVGDECHRYASEQNRLALAAAFPRRLGLTATFARPDNGHADWLVPYFGPTCFRLTYARATREEVVARFALALVGVRFEDEERAVYEELSERMKLLRARLLAAGLVRADAFLQDVGVLAAEDGEAAGLARGWLAAMQQRRGLLAETPAKEQALRHLAAGLRGAARTLVFTQSIEAAERAARCVRALGLPAEPVHSGLDRGTRRAVLERFRSGEVRVATAPQVLDEGIDVPDADLAVVLAASRSKRQMIQRMGRVLRRKPDHRLAKMVLFYVEDTLEDPALGAHEGFVEEATAVATRQQRFSSGDPPDRLNAFLLDPPLTTVRRST